MACGFTQAHNVVGAGQLDHWERLELKRALETQKGVCRQGVARG